MNKIKENTQINLSTKPKQYSVKMMFLFGLNFLFGYGFFFSMGYSFENVGNYFLIILMVDGIIAFTVGISFAKLSTKIKGYGGSYLYVKRAFGKFAGYMAGWFQYIQSPLAATAIIASIVWTFSGWHGFTTNPNFNFFERYKVYLFVIAFIIFFSTIVVLYFGLVSTSWALKITWILKWVVILIAIMLTISYFFIYPSIFVNNIFNNGYKPKNLNFGSAVNTLIVFFFAFGGIEGISAITKDLNKNERHKMSKIIIGIVLTTAIFYVLIFLLFLGTLGAIGESNSLIQKDKNIYNNPINLIFNQLFGQHLKLTLFSSIVAFITILAQISTKFISHVQNGWINTRLIAPLAVDGYLPVRFAKKNIHHQFKNALFLDSALTFVLSIIYLIFLLVDPKLQNILSATIDIYSLVVFMQYAVTLAAAIKLSTKKHRVLNISQFEKCWYAIVVVLLIFLLLFYIFNNIINSFSDHVYQLFLFFLAGILGILLYFIGDWLNWKKEAQRANLTI